MALKGISNFSESQITPSNQNTADAKVYLTKLESESNKIKYTLNQLQAHTTLINQLNILKRMLQQVYTAYGELYDVSENLTKCNTNHFSTELRLHIVNLKNYITQILLDHAPKTGGTIVKLLLTCQSKSGENTLWDDVQNVLFMIENDNAQESKKRFLKCINPNGGKLYTDKTGMMLANILEMKIVPINFHALQREIPFINLMNYSSFYDSLITSDTLKFTENKDKHIFDEYKKFMLHHNAKFRTNTISLRLFKTTPKFVTEIVSRWSGLLPAKTHLRNDIVPGTNCLNHWIINDVIWHCFNLEMLRKLVHEQLEWSANPIVTGMDAINEEVTMWPVDEDKFDIDQTWN